MRSPEKRCDDEEKHMSVELNAVIESIWENAQRGVYYPHEWHGKLALDQAYRVNLAITERRIALGARQAGWKVGVTSKAMQIQQGVHEPVFGVLFESGHRASGCAFNFSELIAPAFENELCLTLGKTLLGPGIDIDQARAAIAEVAPALEIIERRGQFADLPLAMADNAQQKAFVTGPATCYTPERRLRDATVEVFVNAEFKERASGAEVMGDPAASLAWLANKLAEFGRGLDAGMCVMSGSFTKQYPLRKGDRAESRFQPFGTVLAEFR
jgi:2-keto-4-pentenoate hydratase